MLIKAVLGSAGIRIAGMLFGFLVGVQLARKLGAEGYGIYGLAMSIVALLTVPTEFGLPQLITRELSAAHVTQDWGRMRGVLAWSAKSVLLTSALMIIAVFVWQIAVKHDLFSPLASTVLYGLILVPLVALTNMRSAALRGLQHIVSGQIPDTLIRPLTFSLLLLVLPEFIIPFTSASAMGLGAASAAIALVCASVSLRRHMPQQMRAASPNIQSRRWWSSVVPLTLSQGMRILQGHLVILVLGWLVSVSAVGNYRIATSVALLVALPVTILNVVSAPVIARQYQQGNHETLQRLLSWFALSMVAGSALLSLPFVFAGLDVLKFVFGGDFVDAEIPLLVMCANTVINGFFGTNSILLEMSGRQIHVTRASAISLCCLGFLAPLLIWQYAIIGAAVANGVAMLVWNTIMWRDAQRLLLLDTSFMYLLKPKFKLSRHSQVS